MKKMRYVGLYENTGLVNGCVYDVSDYEPWNQMSTIHCNDGVTYNVARSSLEPVEAIQKIEDNSKLVERKRQYIDEVMDFFDFATVAKTMKALEWKWHNAFEGIPAEHEIRTHARKLMNSLSFRQSPNCVGYTGSGGLYAEAFYNDKTKEMEGIRLHFVVAEWDAYDGE